MRQLGVLVTGALILLIPAPTGAGDPPRDDPLQEIVEAIQQGRHWHATQLLADLEAESTPETALLAARANAGRRAWPTVIQQLDGQPWLDSLDYGAGRALVARAWLEIDEFEHAAESYRIFLSYSVQRRPRALAEIGLARAVTASGRPREAAAAYTRAGALEPDIAPWLALRAAEVLAPTGDTSTTNRFLDRAPDIAAYRRVLAAATSYERAGDPRGALTHYLDAADAEKTRSHSADLRARAAEILLLQGDTSAARGVLRTALRGRRGSTLAAAELLAQLKELGSADFLALATAFERARAYSAAARSYKSYLETARVRSAERQRIQLRIGELLFRARSYYAAIETLETLVASEPSRSLRAQAEYLIARATYRRGWRNEGRRRLRQVADRYPGTGSALRALTLLADLYEGGGANVQARATDEELIHDYPGSRSALSAHFRLGVLDFLAGDYQSAARHFDRVRRGEQRSERKTASIYWAARSRIAQNSEPAAAEAERLLRQAQRRAPFSYYGLLSAERLGIDPWLDLPPGPEPAELDEDTRQRLAVIDVLQEAGLTEEAQAVLDVIVASASNRPEELLAMSGALARHGFGGEAVRLGWLAHLRSGGRWSESVLKAIYPLAFADIIVAEARSRALEPYLVAAIARQESAFQPDVVSRAGARGLLQIMPQTGRWWATRMGIRDYSDELLFHPEINVHLGAAYFASLQRRYRELALSLVAYNAGPSRARRWSRRPAYRADRELFTERIPFSETRTYVRNVQTQLRIYRELYRELLPAGAAD